MPRGPRPKNVVPAWALALKMRRLQLGNLTQEDVQARSGDLISQGTISDLERGKVSLDSLNVRRAAALARALNWSLAQLQEATGVDLGVPNAEALKTGEPTPVYLLKDLVDPNAQPHGFNITPNNGKHPKNWRQTVMDGDEMTDAIRDGESLYFDLDITQPGSGVFIITHAGKVYVRRYAVLPSGPAWVAANSAYAHQFIPASDDVGIVGRIYRVVGIREDTALFN